jgi:large subunit ribosomal protein L28
MYNTVFRTTPLLYNQLLEKGQQMRQCAICLRKPITGKAITHRGMLKVKGGVGRRTVRVNPRRFLINLQRATIVLNGGHKRVRVCTSCLKSGRVLKAPPKPSRRSP